MTWGKYEVTFCHREGVTYSEPVSLPVGGMTVPYSRHEEGVMGLENFDRQCEVVLRCELGLWQVKVQTRGVRVSGYSSSCGRGCEQGSPELPTLSF